ncbi:hypothetical protein D9619_007193 [Psilocybe cf. subviscida]|uniref:Cytochrome P450 n=1 Tax=Psilocybe cf. subviscida TaxID=2480587 RepID=A0A8H5EWU7_9AGAR|nr:hypothetical protein D9619_007193 [Psilocybe cf. subviscida]
MGLLQDYLPSQIVLAVFIGAIVIYAIQRSQASALRSLPLPPGPSVTSWLSGHQSIIPVAQPWKVYAKWADKYGPIVHLRVYGQHSIILSSVEHCIEVFEKRSNLYSDRPRLTMINLMGWDFAASLLPYGSQWRKQRRLFQQAFKRVSSLSYRSEQTRKVNDMLYDLLMSPDDFRNHVKTMAAATSLSIAYGYDVKAKDDDFVDLAEASISRLSLAVFPGAALVNAVPVLRYLPQWFPGAGFHKVASETKEMTTKMKDVPLQWVQKNMQAGNQPKCLVSEKIPACKTDGDLADLQEFAAMVYAGEQLVLTVKFNNTHALRSLATTDTTATALETFFYAMTICPDAQRKAQQELDAIVGSDRLPNYDDWDSLPYIGALLREVLRWRPVLPLGVAHANTDNDVFKGCLIPKGSNIIANIWAISRDGRRYKDPEAFKPERFFDKDGSLNHDNIDYAFGFGRRTPYGPRVPTTLWAFSIAKTRDASGNEIPINVEYTDGLVSHPHPHECSITPRSPQTGEIVEEAVAQTRARSS